MSPTANPSSRVKGDELYDLEADLGERNNLAEKFPDKVSELKALMTTIEGRDAKARPSSPNGKSK